MNRARLLLIALMGAVLILATACGGQADTPTPEPTIKPTEEISTKVVIKPTTPPTKCEGPTLEISVNDDFFEFDQDQLQVAEGDEVALCFRNVSVINRHNWVLVREGTKDGVATQGLEAGPDNDYVQPGDPDVVARTDLIKPGEVGEARFTAPPAGPYQFVCTFPGHNFTMFGDFMVTP